MKRSEKRRVIAARHVLAWQASGQTRAVYCATQGINVCTFDYWRRREKLVSPLATQALNSRISPLVPVIVRPAPLAVLTEAGLSVDCGNVRIRLPQNISASWVSELVRGLFAC